MNKEIKPLWRKKNKEKSYKTHAPKVGAEYDRGTKNGTKKSMSTDNRYNSKDYTPLYKYLLKHVGEDFDEICSKIYPRLDDRDRIMDIIDDAVVGELYPMGDICRVGESSYYSTLIVDGDNKLQIKNSEVKIEHLYPSCECCTHTFNGIPYSNKYNELKR